MTTEVSRVADRYNLSRLVPSESITQAPVPVNWPQWNVYLNQLCDEVDEDNKFNEILRHRKWLTVIRYYEGQQGGFIDANGNWQTVSRRPGDAIHVSNIFQYFVNILIKEILRSNGKLQVKARGDRFDLEFGARVYSEIFSTLQETIWTPQERNRDTRNAILCGNSFVRTFKVNDYDRTIKVPRYETKSNQIGDGVYTCGKCNQMGEESHLQATGGSCAYCGAPSDAVSIRRAANYEYQELVGYDECPGVKIDSRGVSPFSIKLDSASDSLETSQHLRVSQLCSDEVLRAMYPWAVIGGDNGQGNQSLQMQRQAQQSPGNYDGMGTPTIGPQRGNRSVHSEYYLEPSKYANYEWQMNERMADGEVIQKGTRALDLFPQGLRVVRSGGIILAVGAGQKNKEFAHWQWDMTTESAYGIGVEHAVESNTSRNELMSLAKAIVLNQAAFSLIINQRKIRKSSLLGKPGHIAVMEKPGPNDSPAAFIHQPVLKDMSPGITNLLEQQKADMQQETGGMIALDSMMEGQTLGGMQIMRDAAISGLLPRIINRDTRDVKLALQWADHLFEDQEMAAQFYAEIADFAEYEIESFRQINPRRHLRITVAEGSSIPRSDLERRAMAIEPLNVGGLPGGIFNEFFDKHPQIRRRVLELSGLPLDTDEYAVDERIQRLEIWDMLKDMRSLNLQAVDENVLAEFRMKYPVRMEDNHAVHVATIVKYLKTDVGRHLSDTLRAILMDHLNQHRQAQLILAQEQRQIAGQQQAAVAQSSGTPREPKAPFQ